MFWGSLGEWGQQFILESSLYSVGYILIAVIKHLTENVKGNSFYFGSEFQLWGKYDWGGGVLHHRKACSRVLMWCPDQEPVQSDGNH